MIEHDGPPPALPHQPPIPGPDEQPPPLPNPAAKTWWRFWESASWGDHKQLTAYATVFLAVSTFALATFSLIQICDFRDQERRQLRAYITSNGGGATLSIEPTTKKLLMHGNVRLHNSGVTPAYKLTVKITTKIAARDAVPFTEIGPISDEYGTAIKRGQEQNTKFVRGLTMTRATWSN